MKLAQLISANPRDIVKIREDSTIAAAADTITAEKIGAILVEDSSGTIVGILSERDIVRGMGPHAPPLPNNIHHGPIFRKAGCQGSLDFLHNQEDVAVRGSRRLG